MQAGSLVGNLAGVLGIRPEEALIVAELKSGSEEAFARLVADYHQPIYSLVARTIQNPADAADLTQDIFIKIYRGISGFHGNASLRTWIYRIALNEASNQRRWWSRHRRQEVTLETEAVKSNEGQPLAIKDTLADSRMSPFESAMHQELREQVEAALRQVVEPFRTAVVLRDLEGFAYEEIAEILNVNLGTVKSRLVRGRAQLKQQLASLAIEEHARDSKRPATRAAARVAPAVERRVR